MSTDSFRFKPRSRRFLAVPVATDVFYRLERHLPLEQIKIAAIGGFGERLAGLLVAIERWGMGAHMEDKTYEHISTLLPT